MYFLICELSVQFSSVQFSHSVVLTLCDPMDYSTPALPVYHQFPELAQTHVHRVGDAIHLILCHPFLLPSVFPIVRVFSKESVLRIRWPKYYSFSFSISLSDEYSELISFRINCFDLLCYPKDSQDSSPALQFKSINSLALSFLCSPIVTSIHDYWKSHSFDYMELCWQMMSLLFNMLSRFVIGFLLRSKHLLISCLQSLSTVILESKKRKSVSASTFSPSICHEVIGPVAMILFF